MASLKQKVKNSLTWMKLKLDKSDFKKATMPEPGKMYLCHYEAKYAATLPVWDKRPLTIFWAADAQHLYGMNFHYLDKNVREALLKKLKTAAGDRKYPQISSSLLSQLAKTDVFKPAIKMYLKSHFKTNLVEIPTEEWENVIHLPLAKWKRN
jgi:hypothetical protein